jgi:hypothetical protein
MAQERFKWLSNSTVTRSSAGSGGTSLDTDHIYNVADFSEAVVTEWVVTGNAEYVSASTATNTVLDVKSPTVKIKVPKIGTDN